VEAQGAEALRCRGCGRLHPRIEGIPVLFADSSRIDAFGLLVALEPVESLAALARSGPDEAPLPHLLDQLSAYLGAWESGFEPFLEKLRTLRRVELSLELGCGTGRALTELARTSRLAVGLDRSGAMLRAARRLLRGEELPYARRMAGREYLQASVRGEAASNAQLVCADALDAPFAPGVFDRVVALNLLDNVPSPRALLHHLHLLAAPGGEIVLSSPFAWRDGIVDAGERLAGPDPTSALGEEMRKLGWRIEDSDELTWTLRRDARSASVYRVHYVRARRE
jgi:SAM-dependent methyltransferase